MQRREDLYGPDALSFRPERWNEEGLANIGWGYLPFNGGPRVCLGSKLEYRPLFKLIALETNLLIEDFALMLASYGLIRVIQEFPAMKLASWEDTNEAATNRHNLAITMSSADGCKVHLR